MRRIVTYGSAPGPSTSPSGKLGLVLLIVVTTSISFESCSFLVIIQPDCLLAFEAVQESHGAE